MRRPLVPFTRGHMAHSAPSRPNGGEFAVAHEIVEALSTSFSDLDIDTWQADDSHFTGKSEQPAAPAIT